MPTEDTSGNDLAEFTGFSVTNDSEFTGSASECFLGVDVDEQERLIFEAMGGNPLCWYGWSREERRQALYEAAGGTQQCFLGRSREEQERLFYEALYAGASSTELVAPNCFNGLSQELKDYNIFAAASATT